MRWRLHWKDIDLPKTKNSIVSGFSKSKLSIDQEVRTINRRNALRVKYVVLLNNIINEKKRLIRVFFQLTNDEYSNVLE